MHFSIILTTVLSATLSLALPHISSSADSKNDIVARGVRGSSRARPRPPQLGGEGFHPPEVNGREPTYHEVVAQHPTYDHVDSLPVSQRPKEGESAVFDHVDNDLVHSEVHFGDTMWTHGSGEDYFGKASPGMKGRVYKSPSPHSTERDSRRRQALAQLKQLKALARTEALDNDAGMRIGGTPLTPHTPQYLDHDPLRAFSMQVLDHEAQQRFAMLDEVSARLRALPGSSLTVHDNRSPATGNLHAQPETGYDIDGFPKALNGRMPTTRPNTYVAPRPANNDGSYGPPIPDQFDLIDQMGPEAYLGSVSKRSSHPRSNRPSHSLPKRQDPITQITGQETGANNGITNTTADLSAEYQAYLAAFDVAQTNISSLLFPVLDAIIDGTNSSMVYDAAWSVFSDLTGSGPYVMGPFLHGLNCIDWIEDQVLGNATINLSLNLNSTTLSNSTSGPYANTTSPSSGSNSTNLADQLAILEYLAVNQVLLDLYNYAWSNGSAAVNTTGLLSDLATLSTYLLPTDPAVQGANWNQSTPTYDSAYFTTYNVSLVPDQVLGNISFTAQNGTAGKR